MCCEGEKALYFRSLKQIKEEPTTNSQHNQTTATTCFIRKIILSIRLEIGQHFWRGYSLKKPHCPDLKGACCTTPPTRIPAHLNNCLRWEMLMYLRAITTWKSHQKVRLSWRIYDKIDWGRSWGKGQTPQRAFNSTANTTSSHVLHAVSSTKFPMTRPQKCWHKHLDVSEQKRGDTFDHTEDALTEKWKLNEDISKSPVLVSWTQNESFWSCCGPKFRQSLPGIKKARMIAQRVQPQLRRRTLVNWITSSGMRWFKLIKTRWPNRFLRYWKHFTKRRCCWGYPQNLLKRKNVPKPDHVIQKNIKKNWNSSAPKNSTPAPQKYHCNCSLPSHRPLTSIARHLFDLAYLEVPLEPATLVNSTIEAQHI